MEVGHGRLTGVVLWHGRERLKVHAAVRKRDVAIRDLSGEIQLGVLREKFARVDGPRMSSAISTLFSMVLPRRV